MTSFSWNIMVCVHPQVASMFTWAVHAWRTCMWMNIINQLRRPILKYAERFVKFWLHYAWILRCVTSVKKMWHTRRQTDKQTQLKFILDNSITRIYGCYTSFILPFGIEENKHYSGGSNSYSNFEMLLGLGQRPICGRRSTKASEYMGVLVIMCWTFF